MEGHLKKDHLEEIAVFPHQGCGDKRRPKINKRSVRQFSLLRSSQPKPNRTPSTPRGRRGRSALDVRSSGGGLPAAHTKAAMTRSRLGAQGTDGTACNGQLALWSPATAGGRFRVKGQEKAPTSLKKQVER